MIEGLWTVRFDAPQYEEFNLTSGVVVIETGRLLGGDSGYYYSGTVTANGNGSWSFETTVVRHDPNIASVFGNIDEFATQGVFVAGDPDEQGRPTIIGAYAGPDGPLHLRLVKVAELP